MNLNKGTVAMQVDRNLFLEQGFLIVEEAIPQYKLEKVRKAYEILVEKQRLHWKTYRKKGGPLGGEWETHQQPRLHLTRPPLVNQIDGDTNLAVEIWLQPKIQGVSTELLGTSDGAITEIMMMCNPVKDHGPAKWHRDLHPIDTAPLQGFIDDIFEGGPRYIQWNIPLYDDCVLWIVPGSHLRLNTKKENEKMLEDPCQPLPDSIQTHLKAGDGVVYILPILHWGSNYSSKLRRTIHGGFSTHTSIKDLSFLDYLNSEAVATFKRWQKRSEDMKGFTEQALKAIIKGKEKEYMETLDRLHPDRGEKGRILSTIFLCKASLSILLAKQVSCLEVPEDLARRLKNDHPITLNWGVDFSDRFTTSEARSLWRRFQPLDTLLQSEKERFVPGFQSGPMKYFFNEMPQNYTTCDFVSNWH